MYIVERTLRFMNGFIKSYGPSSLKKRLWDQEFSSGKWNFKDNTPTDCVYSHVEKYAAKGRILDLGCGAGNTANELAADSYGFYLGVDISQAALDKAAQRSAQNGRAGKNSFAQGDFLSFVPPQAFDVILFRESMYHVPVEKIKAMLTRYSKYLAKRGVFVVRMSIYGDNGEKKLRPAAMLRVMETEFKVLEKREYPDPLQPTVLVFRPSDDHASA